MLCFVSDALLAAPPRPSSLAEPKGSVQTLVTTAGRAEHRQLLLLGVRLSSPCSLFSSCGSYHPHQVWVALGRPWGACAAAPGQSHPTEPPVSSPALPPAPALSWLPQSRVSVPAGTPRAPCYRSPPGVTVPFDVLLTQGRLLGAAGKGSVLPPGEKTSAGGLGWVQPRSSLWQKSHWHGVGQALARSREERLACGTLRDQAKG